MSRNHFQYPITKEEVLALLNEVYEHYDDGSVGSDRAYIVYKLEEFVEQNEEQVIGFINEPFVSK
jgi:hypothetical protein